jgi:hypothetical protein
MRYRCSNDPPWLGWYMALHESKQSLKSLPDIEASELLVFEAVEELLRDERLSALKQI